VTDTFYRTFSEKQLTGAGSARRGRIERARMALLLQYRRPPGRMLEIGPGQGTLAALAVDAGWQYAAVEPSAILAEQLRARGLTVIEAFAPPLPSADAAYDVIYADQVLEHMSGIDAARALTAEARRALTPGGVFFVVVPDYLKERGFFCSSRPMFWRPMCLLRKSIPSVGRPEGGLMTRMRRGRSHCTR